MAQDPMVHDDLLSSAGAPAPPPLCAARHFAYSSPSLRHAPPTAADSSLATQQLRTTSASGSPYVVNLLSLVPASTLLVARDDASLRLVDVSAHPTGSAPGQPQPQQLRTLDEVVWQRGGTVTALRPLAGATAGVGSGWAAAGKKGVAAVWDARRALKGGEVAMLEGPSGAPYLSLAVCEDGVTLAAGTELHGQDAEIDLWDLRQPSAPVTVYPESHSDDVVSLCFHPGASSRPTAHRTLLSAGSDGLASVLDTRIDDEDDAVLGVANLGASVARAGWLDTASSRAESAEEMDNGGGGDAGGDVDMADASAASTAPDGLWAYSDMQTLGVWNEKFDATLPPLDARGPRSLRPLWETDYVIDARDGGANSVLRQRLDAGAREAGVGQETMASGDDAEAADGGDGVLVFVGDQRGSWAIMRVPVPTAPIATDSASTPPPPTPQPWQLMRVFPGFGSGGEVGATTAAWSGGHTDVVRCVEWDAKANAIYTGGEDGRVCVWDVASASSARLAAPALTTAPPLGGTKGGAASAPAVGALRGASQRGGGAAAAAAGPTSGMGSPSPGSGGGSTGRRHAPY